MAADAQALLIRIFIQDNQAVPVLWQLLAAQSSNLVARSQHLVHVQDLAAILVAQAVPATVTLVEMIADATLVAEKNVVGGKSSKTKIAAISAINVADLIPADAVLADVVATKSLNFN